MFLIQDVLFIANVKALSHQKVYKINLRLKEKQITSVQQNAEKKGSTLFSNKKKQQSTIVSLSKVIFAY